MDIESSDNINPALNPETAAAESEIQGLIQSANENTEETRSFMEPKPPKRRGGRPRKNPDDPKWRSQDSAGNADKPTEGEPERPQFDSSTACKLVFGVASNLLVRATRCEGAALLPGEVDALGTVWSKVLDRYMPEFLNAHGDLLTALTVTASVGMRINVELQREYERRKAEKSNVNVVQSEVVK